MPTHPRPPRPRTGRPRPGDRADRERGSTTLAMVIMFPVLLAAVLIALQTALWFLARSTALAAAQEGVRAARAHNAAPDAGRAAAATFAAGAGKGLIGQVEISVRPTATDIQVQVSGTVPSLVPGLTTRVVQVAHGARERFSTPGRAAVAS